MPQAGGKIPDYETVLREIKDLWLGKNESGTRDCSSASAL